MAGYQTLNVTGLQPNSTYTILVYAVRTVNGVVTHSQPTKLSITTPVLSSSGSNFKVTNGGTDMQLLGGTIYAGTFDDGLGQFDPMANSTNGITPGYINSGNYGVALNQFGVAAYNAGVPEFYIDSRNGNAYFAGTLTSTSGTIGGWNISSSSIYKTSIVPWTYLGTNYYVSVTTTLDSINGYISVAGVEGSTKYGKIVFGDFLGTKDKAYSSTSAVIGMYSDNSNLSGYISSPIQGVISISAARPGTSSDANIQLIAPDGVFYTQPTLSFSNIQFAGTSQSSSSGISGPPYTALRNIYLTNTTGAPSNSYGNDGDVVLVYT